MRKLKLQMQLSADGFVAAADGGMDWMEWNWDDKLKEYVTDITEPVDTIILGRILAQGFIPYWTSRLESPEKPEEGAKKMVETEKVVFTKTLETSEWERTTLAKGDIVQEVNELKNKDGKDIIAYGGGGFVSDLIKNNLIDEYHLFINPVLLGGGMPIFKSDGARINLQLIKTIAFSCGITVLVYEPKK